MVACIPFGQSATRLSTVCDPMSSRLYSCSLSSVAAYFSERHLALRTRGCMHAPCGCSALVLPLRACSRCDWPIGDIYAGTYVSGDCMRTAHVIACVPLGCSALRPATVGSFSCLSLLPDRWRLTPFLRGCMYTVPVVACIHPPSHIHFTECCLLPPSFGRLGGPAYLHAHVWVGVGSWWREGDSTSPRRWASVSVA